MSIFGGACAEQIISLYQMSNLLHATLLKQNFYKLTGETYKRRVEKILNLIF